MSTSEDSYYAVYIFNPNRHHSGSGSTGDLKTVQQQPEEKDTTDCKTSDSEDSRVCLSLVEANLDAEQDSVVRRYLLKSLSAKEVQNFENEGKYVSLKLSKDSKQTFGCYYHLLSKNSSDSKLSEEPNQSESTNFSKKYTFVVCLIGKNGVMESFCAELGAFCLRILPLLDPQGIDNKNDVQGKLENWYFYCVQYIERCLQLISGDIVLLLQSALHGKVNIICSEEDVQWDLERLVEACTLTNVLPTCTVDHQFPHSALLDSASNLEINLQVICGKITADASPAHSLYCERFVDRLLSCNSADPVTLRGLLEDFRLKAIQGLNTLRRLLKQAETDYYSLYRAYKFLANSGYKDSLLHHVRLEATLTSSQDSVEVINFLSDFIKAAEQEG